MISDGVRLRMLGYAKADHDRIAARRERQRVLGVVRATMAAIDAQTAQGARPNRRAGALRRDVLFTRVVDREPGWHSPRCRCGGPDCGQSAGRFR